MGRRARQAGWSSRRPRVEHRSRSGRSPCAGPLATRTALRWIGRTGNRRDFTYADLRAETSRFANVLEAPRRPPRRGRCDAQRTHSGALHRGARRAEERQRVLAAVLGLRAGSDRGADDAVARPCARDDRHALSPQGGTDSRAAAGSRTRAARPRGQRAASCANAGSQRA